MTAAAALARARAAGLSVTVVGDRLRWRGPQPTSELLAALRAHKAELLVLISANDAPPVFEPASPEQAQAERQDREAIVAEGAPAAVMPLDATTLRSWEAELATLLAAHPAHRITDPERACSYFAAEARRRLSRVKDDEQAAGLLMGFWRQARAPSCPATTSPFTPLSRRR